MSGWDLRPGAIKGVLSKAKSASEPLAKLGKSAGKELEEAGQALPNSAAVAALSGLGTNVASMVAKMARLADGSVQGADLAATIYSAGDQAMASEANKTTGAADLPEFFNPQRFGARK